MTNEQLELFTKKILDNLCSLSQDFCNLADEVIRLEGKIMMIEFQLSRMRSHIPSMQRLNNFKVVSNDEAEKLHKGIVDRDTEFATPTQEKHRCQCSECDPL